MFKGRSVLPLLFLCTLAAPAVAADLTGSWVITNGSNPVVQSCTFNQSGNSLSGACKGPGFEGPVTGAISGQVVKWRWVAASPNGISVTRDYSGGWDGADAITGKFVFTEIKSAPDAPFAGGQQGAERDFTASRQAGAAP